MLERLIRFSLRRSGLVFILALVFAGYGTWVATQSKLDVFPDFVPPQVDIQTEAAGLAPEQVEQLITRPIETAINGTGDLESVRSESIQGLSVITAVFKDGADVFRSRQAIAERLTETAGLLPAGVGTPKMSPLTSATMDLLKVGLLSEKLSPMALRTYADWTLRPRLQAVPGVAKVTVYGGDVREWQIQVDPTRLATFDLSLTDVLTAAKAATGVIGAGFIETAQQRLVLQSDGQALTADQLGQLVLSATNGHTLRLADVATVVEAAAPKFGDACVMGQKGVLLALVSQYGTNTLEVTQAVEAALQDIEPALTAQHIRLVSGLHRPATFIENALHNVQHSLLLGAAFVGLILILFLLDFRTAFISFLSIPLSLLAAVVVFDRLGLALNTMTLGGFAVAIGVVVDDAIIDVENIIRRLRENAARPTPLPTREVVLHASLEVRSAVVYATFIVAIVFLPVLTMSGLQGRFFAPLGHAFILATLASLLVALTVTPALCYLFLGRAKPHAEPRWLGWIKSAHRALLRWICARPRSAITASFLLFLGTLGLVPHFQSELLPLFREGHLVAAFSTVPGTSLPEMMRLGEKLSHSLLELDHIQSCEQQAGRAEQGEDTWGPHKCEFHIELKPGTTPAEESATLTAVREVFEAVPGSQSEVMTFLGDRIGESISGETAQVVVNLFGDDLDALDHAAADIEHVLTAQAGSTDVAIKSPPGSERLVIRLKHEALSALGFRARDVLEAIQTGYQGTEIGQLYEGTRATALSLILKPELRQDPSAVSTFLVTNLAGTRHTLSELAEIYPTTGRFSLYHDGARRLQTITCNTHPGTDLHAFMAAIQKTVAEKVKLPPGTYAEFSGAAEAETAARRELIVHFCLASLGILLLLTLIFQQPRHVMLILANVPFALVGGVLAAYSTGGVLSIGSLVGFVTLFGISLRNSIMLVSHYEHLVTNEGAPWSLDTALRGAGERVLPILMTALVTALGLLPLALGGGTAGSEIERPMALVILGGLITSTVLNLLILPAMCLQWGFHSTASASKA
jgi:CzcA family heavy metal efflux pump